MPPLPTLEELDRVFKKALEIHSQYLARFGVKMPQAGTNKAIWLSMLVHYLNQPVHKDLISDAVIRQKPEAGRDQQVRHLKRDGWNLKGTGGYHTLDPYTLAPAFQNEQIRRQVIGTEDFGEIKKAYGNACATCGAREGQPDVRYGGENIVLQKGHKDPSKSGADPSNIIPQCQFCNRSYRGDFIFDDKGRPYAVASKEPVKRASKETKREIHEDLRKEFGNGES